MPLNQSAIQVVHRRPCCRRKNKTVHQNDLIQRHQPLSLLRKTNSSTNIDREQCSEKPENLGIAFHAIRDDRPSDDSYNKGQTTVQNNSLSSTEEKQEFSMLPFDTGPDTKQLYNEMVRIN